MIDIKFLSKIPLFSSLSEDELNKMALLWTPLQLAENEIIFKRGFVNQDLYLIEEGAVSISLHAFERDQLILSVLRPGDIFGELTIFDNTPRNATAIAVVESKIYRMPGDLFIDFLKSHPTVAITMLGILGKRLRDTNQLVEDQVARNVYEELEQELTFGEQFANRFAKFVGSWKFITLFFILVCIWIVMNLYINIPFTLNLVLACIAAVQGPLILMSQDRQDKRDRISSDLNYKINLKAELQIQELHNKIDKILIESLQSSKKNGNGTNGNGKKNGA